MRQLFVLLSLLTVLLSSCKDHAKKHRHKKTLEESHALKAESKLSKVISVFDSSFTESFNKKKVPGAAVIIIKDTSVIYQKAFGIKSSKDPLDSVNSKTIFRIGSLSKGFASVLAGIQVQNGCFQWNDKVKSFVPSFDLRDSAQAARIDLKHILSHSTGLPRHAYTTLIEDGKSIEYILPKLSKLKLVGKEGVHLAYQNAAYCIIEKVIESEYQDDFSNIIMDELFTPSGMLNTHSTYASLLAEKNVALPHRWKRHKRQYVVATLNDHFFNAIAAGGIHTNIEDMGLWLNLLLGNRPDIINAETLDQVFQPVVRLGNRRYFRKWEGVKESWYALGWRVFDYHGRTLIYHSGTVNNYRGEIAIDRKNKIAICLLFNATTKLASSATHMFFQTYDQSFLSNVN